MKSMLKNPRVKRTALQIIAATLIFISIGFANREQNSRSFGQIIFKIKNQFDNYFIAEKDLMGIVSIEGLDVSYGQHIKDLDLRRVEQKLEAEAFIKNAQIFRDLKGNLVVQVEQRRPIARIIRSNAPDAYISEDGEILPISENFTSRVMLISGQYTNNLVASENIATKDHNRKYFEMIQYINLDPFWKAQIAQLDIDEKGEVKMYPQVTKQTVEFGLPNDMEEKFKKLRIFYLKVLPFKGWNSYKRVSLKYQDQIVCE